MLTGHGSLYEGQWNGTLQRHGQGYELLRTGDHYVGQWAGDQKNGTGVCMYASGDKYDGGWMDNQMHGA